MRAHRDRNDQRRRRRRHRWRSSRAAIRPCARAARRRCARGPRLAAGETMTWTQIAGPTVTLDTSDPNRIIFTAPNVAQDTALVFRVTRANGAGVRQRRRDGAGREPRAGAAIRRNRAVRVQRHARVARLPVQASRPVCRRAGALRLRRPAAVHRRRRPIPCPLATLPFLHTTAGGNVPTVGADHGPRARVARLDGQGLRGTADRQRRPTPTCCGCSTASPRS